MPTSNERKMLSSNEALKELKCTDAVATKHVCYLNSVFSYFSFWTYTSETKSCPYFLLFTCNHIPQNVNTNAILVYDHIDILWT